MLRAVARAARGRDWTCELVFGPAARARPWLDELCADGIPFRLAGSHSRTGLTRLVASVLDESDEPTVLHTHFTTFDIASVLAARGRPGTAVIWHVHTPHGSSPGLWARNVFKYAVLGRRVARILCVSSELADVVMRRGGPRGRTEHLPNAVDVDRFAPASAAERVQARGVLGLGAAQPALMHFGWDWHRKGGDVFCAAVAALRASGRDVVGVTVGGGAAATAAADGLGLPPEVLRVEEPRDDVRTFHAAADVFIAPSRAEGTPYSVLEAVSSGVPVVASEIPGHTDIGHGMPGVRLVPLEPGAVRDATAALLDRSAEAAARDSQAGRAWMRRNRDLGRWSEELVERYEAALSERPAPATGGR
jgi:D-inositol-3-phosphate glycosyltransferase